jgi:hypothetical protein
MRYTKGTIGRVFVLKFDNNDILLEEISKFAKDERVKAASIVFLGALKKGNLVTGPRRAVIPPVPNWTRFKDAWEVMGIGTIFANSSGPQIHIHTSMGKKSKTLTGCVRKDAKVFLVIEAVVLELKGVKADKAIDPRTGLNLLRIL